MSETSTRDTVIAAARDLFARRGYTATTIKDVAAAAGCSPALVMKLTGSKAELFAAADPSGAALDDPPPAAEPAGYQLVRRIVDRRDTDEPEPWAMAPLLVRESADPDDTRADIRTRYTDAIARRIGDTDPGRVRSQLVMLHLLGLAAGLRHLELLGAGEIDREELIGRVGEQVQAVIDAG